MPTWRIVVEFVDGSEHEFYLDAETEEEAYQNAMPTRLSAYEEEE